MSLLNIFKGWDGELTVKLIHWMYLWITWPSPAGMERSGIPVRVHGIVGSSIVLIISKRAHLQFNLGTDRPKCSYEIFLSLKGVLRGCYTGKIRRQ